MARQEPPNPPTEHTCCFWTSSTTKPTAPNETISEDASFLVLDDSAIRRASTPLSWQ